MVQVHCEICELGKFTHLICEIDQRNTAWVLAQISSLTHSFELKFYYSVSDHSSFPASSSNWSQQSAHEV